MRFLADMGISPRTIALLSTQGHDAVHLVEQGLERMADGDILAKARSEERVLLTVDLDFAQLLAISKVPLPSVILFRLGNPTREVLDARLLTILAECAEVLEAGVIISVSDDAYRVRLLPL
jgi:predicted nuclease of predicted toxin-antitoxin system